ncbi:MAG: heavy metal translocating P-type ATPase [Pirellulales bacterium]|nr:heavy metal translocating P-type ATPase [Pirellulales bacterium]
MDIQVSYPHDGVIRFHSQRLFAEPEGELCRDFLERVLAAQPVRSVTIASGKASPRRAVADVRYCEHTVTRRQAIAEIGGRLLGNAAHLDDAHAVARPLLAAAHLKPCPQGVIRIYRHGPLVTAWQIRHELPGRLRLRHPALYRKKEVCQAVERELMSVLGIEQYKTSSTTGSVLVNYKPSVLRKEQVLEILESALHNVDHPAGYDRPDLSLALSTVGVPLSIGAQFALPPLMPVAGALLAYNSITTFKNAREVLFVERRLGVDVLDAIVVTGCLATGSIFAGSVLTWCLAFGRSLVQKTQDDSKKMLLNVFGKQPRYVWLWRDGVEIETPLDKLVAGDVIVVNTGEVVPVDGTVAEGMAMIDQHALTGESTPAEKGIGDRVFASTVMVAGKVFVRVETSGSETTTAKISRILNDSAGYKLSSQHKGERLADKAVVPTLALGSLAIGTLGPAGAMAVLNSDFGTGIRMAAPLAMLTSLALCAHKGILVKDGRALELLNEIDTVLFDKTGTLTRERPEVGRVIACRSFKQSDILRYAAAAENKFSHPIAKAILEKFKETGLPMPTADESQYHVGYGITVGIEGRKIRVGSKRFMGLEGIAIPAKVEAALAEAHHEGHTMVMVAVDDRLAGALELQASQRPEVEEIMLGLRERGIKHIAIISGDHEAPTRKLAQSLGMDQYFAGVLPADKASYVERLQQEGRKVCFVGDGINDSIALKQANVSISLRGASSIATDTAHIVFMEESLARLLDLLDVARDLDRNVRRSWGLILAPNIACICGAFFLGFGVMASVLTNNVAALAALANGLLPLRRIAEAQAQQEHEQELRRSIQGIGNGNIAPTQAAVSPTVAAASSDIVPSQRQAPHFDRATIVGTRA